MKRRIFRSSLLITMLVLLCCLGILIGFVYDYYDDVQVRQLKDELGIAAAGMEQDGLKFLKDVRSERFRLTWIRADGTVIYDTIADENTMANHAEREEVISAFATGSGSAKRYSDTLTERTLYEAIRLNDGTVLRISMRQATVTALLRYMLLPIVLVIALCVVLSLILSKKMSRRITEPLDRLNLEAPLENEAYPEIEPLLQRLNVLHLQIDAQMQKLKQKTAQFEQSIGNMSEGLLLLDQDGQILTVNPAALRIFRADADCVGKNILAIDRDGLFRNAINETFLNGHCQMQFEREGKNYHIGFDRITDDEQPAGAVILAIDMTQQKLAEYSRREFSANVSHELKTPLQSIIGSAELLKDGFVKQEDIPTFLERIHKEASRLVVLIEDIIRLSQLDEKQPIPTQTVALDSLAQEVVSILRESAEKKKIRLTIHTEPTEMIGVPRLLSELLTNLCDNAIKYTNAGGSVEVEIKNKAIIVRDNGIGIAPEHHMRIFERFYRVDKSHSRRSGGTGLGLSIVKHAAEYHNASVTLESALGQGTSITVQF
ncbi:MAG: PAS domain-containing protein [Ruminococcaceae bacterium]|nr:PAS domain-containing protein [Oscillospiraceae bacterium]